MSLEQKKRIAAEKYVDGSDNVSKELEWEATITGRRDLPTAVETPRALVTGGSSGIGRGIALQLAERGYDLVITYRSGEEEALAVKEYIESRWKRRCEVLHLDIENSLEIENVVSQMKPLMGGIDLLVNNAGITIFEEAFEDSLESLDKLMAINFRGTMLMLQQTAKVMKEQEHGGNIINISSIHGQHHDPQDAIYGASKAAIERAMKTYAVQYGPHNIRVNTIAPGAILVDRTRAEGHDDNLMDSHVPLGRIGLPRDIAHAVMFLASEQASYITGVTLLIDGGMALI